MHRRGLNTERGYKYKLLSSAKTNETDGINTCPFNLHSPNQAGNSVYFQERGM
jgi:hypothetical protein